MNISSKFFISGSNRWKKEKKAEKKKETDGANAANRNWSLDIILDKKKKKKEKKSEFLFKMHIITSWLWIMGRQACLKKKHEIFFNKQGDKANPTPTYHCSIIHTEDRKQPRWFCKKSESRSTLLVFTQCQVKHYYVTLQKYKQKLSY